MARLNSIKRLTDNKYLNLCEANYTNEAINKDFNYYIATRRSEEEMACKTKDHKKCDAIMIVPVDKDGGIYLIKQFRPAINDYILECPAGLVDPGELIEEAVTRELFEETGLKANEIIVPVTPPCYTSVGMTDETVAIYYTEVEGEPDTSHKEENEDIEVLHFTQDQFVDLQHGVFGPISIKTYLLIALFGMINDEFNN